MVSAILAWCIFCTLVYSGISLVHLYRKRELDGFLVVSLMFDLVYGFYPTIVSWQILFDGSQSAYLRSILNLSDDGLLALFYYYLLSFIGYFSLVLAYFGKIKNKRKFLQKKYTWMQDSDSLLSATSWICLIIGAVSLYLWSRAYGSIVSLMKIANSVRSGYGGVSNSLAFFKHPAKVVLICTFMFFALLTKEKKDKRFLVKFGQLLGFALSSILSYLYLIANDGRLTIFIFLIALLWLWIAGKKIRNISKTIILGCGAVFAGLILLVQMDNITNYIRFGVWTTNGSQGKLLSSVVRELSFLPRGGQISILSSWNGEVGLTILDDTVTGIVAWLPTKFKPTGFLDVWNINTLLMFGDLSVLHGQAPCSIITQAYYDLRIIGVLVFCFLLGRLMRKIDSWTLDSNALIKYAIKANIMEILFRLVPYFSFYDIVLGLFPLAVVILVYKVAAYFNDIIKRV